MTKELGTDLKASEKDKAKLEKSFKEIQDTAQDLADKVANGENVNLDERIIEKGEDGKFGEVIVEFPNPEEPAPETPPASELTLKEMLVGHSFDVVPLNEAYLREEGIFRATYSEDVVTVHDEPMDIEYLDDGFKTEDGKDTVVFTSEKQDFLITVTAQDDMNILVEKQHQVEENNGLQDLAVEITEAALIDHTFYHIFDDAPAYDETARPALVQFTFKADGELELVEEGETATTAWEINGDELVITFPGENNKQGRYTWTSLKSGSLQVAYYNEGVPVFFIGDEAVANSIYNQWKVLAK